ncbi:hypothetical protein [Miltoncostaea marina]|uniref:hypothetical protein n=1 Tax=Miltoncostaea marina TaxID=2843215 RepID=UPI001C3C5BA3|nr:hypothetical protein [Miltoncostaea marina]
MATVEPLPPDAQLTLTNLAEDLVGELIEVATAGALDLSDAGGQLQAALVVAVLIRLVCSRTTRRLPAT